MTSSVPEQTDATAAESGASDDYLAAWLETSNASIDSLRRMACTTEDEFLQIGSKLQDFHQRSAEISDMAGHLVEIVSGDRVQSLTDRLQQMMADMEAYLADAHASSSSGGAILEKVLKQLDELSEPLEGFQKMNKALRMLGISTKIESARLGDTGSGFVTLAQDVEQLSHKVHEKSASILSHRLLLSTMIAANLKKVHSSESVQNERVTTTLRNTAGSLQELMAVNGRCTQFGTMVSTTAAEVTGSIGEVVASLQLHDITRQQVEHVVEALERLSADLSSAGSAMIAHSRRRVLTVESGDVCELQEAQLRFACDELYLAVRTIVENLRDVAREQSRLARETTATAGATDSTGASFLEVMRQGMMAIIAVLASCARADRDMAGTMGKVAQTIGEITSFVADIEYIGSEIDLIAINAQIKAAHTGPEGAALGVLAEAIKRLSDEAVRQTNSVSSTLTGINAATRDLSTDDADDGAVLGDRIATLQNELGVILGNLGDMNAELNALLSGLNNRVATLTEDVEGTTASIDVQERTKRMADEVLSGLDRIVAQARRIEPASTEFKQNLLHMEERYTMDSERHIHEAIARKRGVQFTVAGEKSKKTSSREDSEFGANVDLF